MIVGAMMTLVTGVATTFLILIVIIIALSRELRSMYVRHASGVAACWPTARRTARARRDDCTAPAGHAAGQERPVGRQCRITAASFLLLYTSVRVLRREPRRGAGSDLL